MRRDVQKEHLDKILVDGGKTAVITDSNHVKSLAKSANGNFEYKILQEKIITDYLSFMMVDPSNIFHKIFDRKIQQFVETGIANKIANDALRVKLKISVLGPNILTLDHVKIWFVIWFYGLIVAFLTFFVEFSFRNRKKILKIVLKY